MQNVVNLHTSFLYNGNPIVNGRVYFVKEDTSALTFDQVLGLDNAFFIPVYDKSGTPLENPLSLDSEGCFSVQPFVDNGLNFKMIVCRPTGIDADLNDETPAWDVAYTMVSKAPSVDVEYDGIDKVSSLTELRQQDPSAGSVLVLGYNSANDFCPPRIFSWKSELLADNGGTHVRSAVEGKENAGTWVCEPSYYVDVRWFGVSQSTTDCWDVINAIVQTYYPNMPVYLPSGNYNFSENISFESGLVLDRNAVIRPVNKSIIVSVNNLENRGGLFGRKTGSSIYWAVPKIKGVLYTSLLVNEGRQITAASLSDVTEIVFDKNVARYGTSDITISNKRILVKSGVSTSGVVFENCEIFEESSASFQAEELRLGKTVKLVYDEGGGTNPYAGFYLKRNGLNEWIFLFSYEETSIRSLLKIPALQVGEHDDYQDGWTQINPLDPRSFTLLTHLAKFGVLAVDGQLLLNGSVSHAKSGCSRIRAFFDLSYTRMTLEKGSESYNVYIDESGFFDLSRAVSVDTGLEVDIFHEERDWNLFVETRSATNVIRISFPPCANESKIVSVFASGKAILSNEGQYSGVVNGVRLYDASKTEMKIEGQTGTNDNVFFGLRKVRKESTGNWVYDPFVI